MNSLSPLEVYGIVPASGFSRRMGKQKLLLPWQNKALLEHVLEAANRTTLEKIIAVIPAEDADRRRIVLKANADVVYNTRPGNGIGHSLALGMKHIPKTADAVMILLGDQPELKGEDIERVLEYFSANYLGKDPPAKIIVQTQYADGKIGHPILFSKAFFSKLALLNGDSGGNRIIQSNFPHVVHVNSVHPYPPDIDTLFDYEDLLSRQ
ncbi:nucleotidyltransferase family protein [Bacillus xiapuensis]|uniref:Nucleotidyltransferase family protein n=1 Tax=Bacillus xiapuensis TaxID=2014075 RepID=A0ABU6NGD8_9BACI|nr:nucleotidyltransferase family protein [Bacillus xiapuensis]